MYKFIALDLETTGLDPQKDTIIEVAAISFTLKEEDGVLKIDNQDERTMLINPGRELREEVTMITGISSEMLIGKPHWEDVRDRVSGFINDDTIIVGHNVSFDISMLHTHGIDLKSHAVIDTFELAELLSQEAESLNLGFLGGKYGFSAGEAEHRALGDTRLSVSLFLRYMNEVRTLPERGQSIFQLLAKKEEMRHFALMREIVGHSIVPDFVLENPAIQPRRQSGGNHNPTPSIQCTSLDGNRETTMDYLLGLKEQYGKITILSPNRKTQSYLTETLSQHGIQTISALEISRFCSIDALKDTLAHTEKWGRKLTIFIGKLLFWIGTTKTGLLEELKYYGEEREQIRFFRMGENEGNIYFNAHKEQLENADCIVYETGDFLRNPPIYQSPCIVIDDIPLLEDIVRKMHSIHINITSLAQDIRCFPGTKNLLYTLYIVGDIFESLPQRPTGDQPFPPGDFGETYFFTQDTLWEQKGKWLVLFAKLLGEYLSSWQEIRQLHSRKETIQAQHIDTMVRALIHCCLIRDRNTSIIIHIRENETHIRLIPRSVNTRILHTLSRLQTDTVIATGPNLHGPMISRFLAKECGIIEPIEIFSDNSHRNKVLTLVPEDINIALGSVILGTSQKQIREIGKGLSLKHPDALILIQGISGGKEKMLSLFRDNSENAILIGLIDTWKDEFALWKVATSICIVKLPFDPPSDPYFLARTVGMSDNFNHYSQPMTIIRINTLINRIRSSGYHGNIYCTDHRLTTTLWGQEIAKELL